MVVAAALLWAGLAGAIATTEGKKGLLQLGDPAPDFSLTDVVSGKTVSLMDFKGRKGFLVMIVCRHCPFVQHVKKELTKLAVNYAEKDIAIVAISANDPAGYPDDAPDKLKAMAVEEGWDFPLLFDESQAVAKAYTAVATPDFYLFDENRYLVYRGQLDDSRPGNDLPLTGGDLRAAIDALLAGEPLAAKQKPSSGCSIKWKEGGEPAYL